MPPRQGQGPPRGAAKRGARACVAIVGGHVEVWWERQGGSGPRREAAGVVLEILPSQLPRKVDPGRRRGRGAGSAGA